MSYHLNLHNKHCHSRSWLLRSKTISWAYFSLFLTLFISPISARSQEPAYDEISLFFQVKNIGATEIPALIRDQEVLLPAADIFEFLRIKNTLSRGMDSISGFFLTPEATYLINRMDNKITFQGKTFQVKPGDLVRTETNLYLHSGYFGQVFGLDCKFDFRALSVSLTTKLELPATREVRLEQMRQNISKLKGDLAVDTVIPRSRPAFHFGMADWSVISTQTSNQKTDTRFNLALGTVIAGGEANAFLNYNTGSKFTEKQQYYYLRFVNNDRRFLRQTTLGKITTDAISSIYDPVVGIRLSNTPTTYRRSFGTYPISDYTNPGWTVELYVNNVLVDYKKADASGFFTFDVPLVYGNSAVKLKFYGPWGEERLKEQQISIPFNFLPPKEFEYVLNAGMVEDSLNSVYSRAAMNYGVSRGITVGAGVEFLSSVVNGPVMPFVNLTTRPLSNMLLSGEFVYNVRGKGIFSYQMPRNILFEINYTKYKEGQKAVNYNYLEERKAILTLPVNGKHFSFYNRMTYNQIILPGTGYSTAEWLISGTALGVNTNLTNYAMFVRDSDPYIYSNLSFSFRLPYGFLFIPQAQYEYTQSEIISVRSSLEKYLFKNGFFSLTYENNLKINLQSLQLTLKYDLPFARTGITARMTNEQSSLIEMAQGSLIVDHKTRYTGTNNRVSVGKGGIVFAPFLDRNCNNLKDPGEMRVNMLNIHVSGGTTLVDERDTTIRVMDLEPYTKYYVELDPNSFENVAWKLNKKAMSIASDPNMFKLVEIPIAIVGEVTGMIYRKKGSEQEGIGRILVNIFDMQGRPAGKVLSEPDGYFSYLGLAPGEYEVRIDETQAAKLNLTASPARQKFSVRESMEGDIVEGMDFVLTSTQPETPSNVKKNAGPTGQEPAAVPAQAPVQPVSQDPAAAPAKTGQKAVVPAATPPVRTAPAGKYYYVQCGAFRDRQGAENVRASLAQKSSYPTGIQEEEGYFKVVTGPFSSWKEAENLRVSLQQQGFSCFSRRTATRVF